MNQREILLKMLGGHEVHTTYIGQKFYTARIDGVDIDTELFSRMVTDSDNIICNHFTKPNQWDEDSKGLATYAWVEIT